MKYLIVILISFAANAKVFTVSAKWSCNRLDFSSETVKLPLFKNLSIKVDTKNSQLKIVPNIFDEVDLLNKDSVVNSDSCVKRLLSKVSKGIKKYSDSCNGCNLSSKEVMDTLKGKILKSKYFSNTKLIKLPRVYSGHNEYTGIVNYSLVEKFCSQSKLNSKEIIAVAGIGFIKQMSLIITSNKDAFPKTCIDEIKKVHEKFSFKNKNCEANSCKEIIEESNVRDEAYSMLEENFVYAKNKEDIQNLQANGYHKATPEIRNKILNDTLKDPIACAMNHTVRDSRRYLSIYRYDDAMSEFIDKYIQSMSQECIRDIVQSYITTKENHLSSDLNLCTSTYCKTQTNKYHENILKLMSYNHSKKQLEYFCKNQPKDKSYESFLDTWNKLDDVLMCTELKVGESRVLKNVSNDVLGHYHSLKRLSDKKYEASLAIKFTSPDPIQNQNMRKRVNDCISKTSEYFKSPSGEQMDVKIITPLENQKKPINERLEVVSIDIAAKGVAFRSHSKKYEESISCEVITHELLHLMGLVDEYHEHWNKVYFRRSTKEVYNPRHFPRDKDKNNFETTTAYVGCRSHSQKPSVMSSQGKMFQEAVKKKISCECKTDSCKQFIKNMKNLKISLFSTPEQSNLIKYCKRSILKNKKLSQDYEFDGKFYKNKNFSQSSLEFEIENFDMGTDLKTPRLVGYKYSCICQDDSCRKYINYYKNNFIDKNKFNSRNYCFSGATQNKSQSSNIAFDSAEPYKVNNNGTFSFTTTPSLNSLLRPAHFEQLKWGSCSSKASKYKSCAKYAYKSLDFQCSDKPKYCDSDEGWLTSIK